MKTNFAKILVIALLAIGSFVSVAVNAQAPPPPPDAGGAGGSTPMGGSAPLDGGLGLLIALGIGFGTKKVYALKSEKKAE